MKHKLVFLHGFRMIVKANIVFLCCVDPYKLTAADLFPSPITLESELVTVYIFWQKIKAQAA